VGDVPKVLHTPATRATELTERMKGGVHQSHIPSWRFEGRQVSTSGAKRDETKPVDDAYKSPALAASVNYHTTIRPCVGGEKQAAEVLNLFGHRSKSMKDLRCYILRLCFRKLSIVGVDQWERNMGLFRHWREFAAALRLAQGRGHAPGRSSAVLVPTVLDRRSGMQMARPYNPVEDDLEADEELEMSYPVSAPVPSCAMWNFLTTRARKTCHCCRPRTFFSSWLAGRSPTKWS
jgi:hypothetical protein